MSTTIDINPEADEKIKRLIRAHDAGANVAKALRPGDVFVGSTPAAEAAGYARNSEEWICFSHGFLGALPRPIWTRNEDSVILPMGAFAPSAP